MDEGKINEFIAKAAEQIIALERQYIQLRASVSAIKFVLADEVNRNHPEEALAFFRRIEQKILDADPHVRGLEEASEIMEAVRLWQEHGKHEA